jgi:hypothetical protein
VKVAAILRRDDLKAFGNAIHMCVPSVRLRKPGCAGFSAIRAPKIFNPVVEDDHRGTDQASYTATIIYPVPSYPVWDIIARAVGGNRLRFRRLDFVLKFSVFAAMGVFMDRSFVPSIVPNGPDQNFYLVINNYGNFGPAFAETDVGEADLETVIGDLMSGQYSDPVRVVAFNTAEHWAKDASEDVAREVMRRFDQAGHELPSSILHLSTVISVLNVN